MLTHKQIAIADESRKTSPTKESLEPRLKENVINTTKRWIQELDMDTLVRDCHKDHKYLFTRKVCLFPDVIRGELPDIIAKELQESPEYKIFTEKCAARNLICEIYPFQACFGPEITHSICSTPQREGRNSIAIHAKPCNEKEYLDYINQPIN